MTDFNIEPVYRAKEVWVAHLETTRFTFTAVGNSEADAIQRLHKGVIQHAKNCGVPDFWNEYKDAWRTCQFKGGECYLDFDHNLMEGK